MSWTDEVWLRTALDAMRTTFGNDPHQKKEMIDFLLDEGFWDKESLKSWEAATARFNDCLNPNKAQFFKVSEVWALMKRFDRPQLFLAMAEDLGYEVRKIPTETRRQLLLERIATAYESCQHSVGGAQAELQRLTAPETQRAGGGGNINGKAHFSLGPDPALDLPPAAREGCL